MRQIPAEFDDIRPYADHEVREQFEVLLRDRLFMRILRGFVPLPRGHHPRFFAPDVLGSEQRFGFQKRYMYRVMQILIAHTTRQLTFRPQCHPHAHGRLHLYFQSPRHSP